MSDEIVIENVVATAELGLALDLTSLERPLEADPFEPQRFPGLVVRQRGTTFLIFPDGRVRLTGPKSIEEAKKRIQALTERLAASGVRLEERFRFWVDNLVVATSLPTALSLDQVALALGEEHTAFDPEAFPGLLHRTTDPPATLLLFPSGRLVATGIGDRDTLFKLVRRFVADLRARALLPGPTVRSAAVAAEGS